MITTSNHPLRNRTKVSRLGNGALATCQMDLVTPPKIARELNPQSNLRGFNEEADLENPGKPWVSVGK